MCAFVTLNKKITYLPTYYRLGENQTDHQVCQMEWLAEAI